MSRVIHTQRIAEDLTISSTDYDSVDNTTYTNVDVIKTTAFSLATAGTSAKDLSTIVINSSGQQLQEVAAADIDLVASIGKYYYHTDKTVWFIRAADEQADIADYRTALGTSGIQYQLATPIATDLTTELLASGVLQGYTNGTIYQDCINGGEEVTSSGTPDITLTIPIREITQLTYTTAAGRAEVPTSGLTLSADGLTITGSTIPSTTLCQVKGYLKYNISPLLTANAPVNQSAVISSLNETTRQNSKQITSLTDTVNLIIAGL